jgi:hypothetical protein
MLRSQIQELIEVTYSDGQGPQPTVDREQGVIRGVKVIGRQSRNGREYSPGGTKQLCDIYEGMGVNLNHPKPQAMARDRWLGYSPRKTFRRCHSR